MPGAIGDASGVDLNRASEDQLERVGGLGRERAQRIIQDRTRSEKERYHNYGSADEVIRMYKDDLSSENAKPVNNKLKELGLPRLVDVRQEFERKAA